jgi:hypothetical protein
MLRPSAWALLGMMALSDGLLGCDLGCDKEDDLPVPFAGGRQNLDRTFYETNDWNEPYVKFSAGRRLAIQHGLGTEPEIFTWLAFDEEPFERDREDEDGSTAESAGNMVIIQRVTDQIVQVRNDTCQDFWLRLVAISPGEFGTEPGQGGAGGSE